MTAQQRLKYNIMWANKWRRQYSATPQAHERAISELNASAGHTRRGSELTPPGTIKMYRKTGGHASSTVSPFFAGNAQGTGAMYQNYLDPNSVIGTIAHGETDNQKGLALRNLRLGMDTER